MLVSLRIFPCSLSASICSGICSRGASCRYRAGIIVATIVNSQPCKRATWAKLHLDKMLKSPRDRRDNDTFHLRRRSCDTRDLNVARAFQIFSQIPLWPREIARFGKLHLPYSWDGAVWRDAKSKSMIIFTKLLLWSYEAISRNMMPVRDCKSSGLIFFCQFKLQSCFKILIFRDGILKSKEWNIPLDFLIRDYFGKNPLPWNIFSAGRGGEGKWVGTNVEDIQKCKSCLKNDYMRQPFEFLTWSEHT